MPTYLAVNERREITPSEEPLNCRIHDMFNAHQCCFRHSLSTGADILLHCASKFGILTAPAFVALAEAAQRDPIASKTVQHRLKLTAAVVSWVVITPLWTLLRLLTMDGKLPIKTFREFVPSVERPLTFIKVAS